METRQRWDQEPLERYDVSLTVRIECASVEERAGHSDVSEVRTDLCPEQSCTEFARALEESDLEMFADVWRRSGDSARQQFVINDGDKRMRDAFGIGYLRVFLAQ